MLEVVDSDRLDEPETNGKAKAELTEGKHGHVWETPEPLPGLPLVPKWKPEFAAQELSPWLVDIAKRIQCPPDFPPVPAYTSASSLIGTKCGLKPKRKDDWIVAPNLWGVCVGRPSAMKTPPSQEVLRQIKYLNTKCREDYDAKEFDRTTALIQQKGLQKKMDSAVLQGSKPNQKAPDLNDYREDFDTFKADLEAAEARKRYMVQNTTTERLGEILAENPAGLMLYRDELKGWFRSLDKAGREEDRAFYMECWNGTGSYLYDRVGRGEVPIPSACVSIYGTIQPGPLGSLLRAAVDGTADDDGMIQRFQLMVYPDRMKSWRNVDTFPDSPAKQAADAVYRRLADATPDDFGADTSDPNGIPFLRFTPEAQKRFDDWREVLMNRLLQGDEHPAFEAHLSKYASLIPSLALINHLIDVGNGPVGLDSLERALLYADYLELHARRVYSTVAMPDVDAARALLARLKKGQLDDPFHPRDVYRKNWTGLHTPEAVRSAVSVLEDYGWLLRVIVPTATKAREDVYVHPCIKAKWKP